MTKEQMVINYYVLCNRLKNVIRTGWVDWHVNKERIESVAEHIYGVEMLAIAMYQTYKYDIDFEKVMYMIAIHELGEVFVGDLTEFEISKEEKTKKEHKAVHNMLKDLLDGETVEKLFLEFDERKTPEAYFAYQCDKLECDLQCKLYDEEHCVDLEHQEGNTSIKHPFYQEMLPKKVPWSTMWLSFDQAHYKYDENFMSVSKYAMNNKISEEKDN